MKAVIAIVALIALAGCATQLTPDAAKIRLVSASQKEGCTRIRLVTFNQRLGPDKPGNALKGAMNEAAAVGANSFYIVSSSVDWANGASVVGEALRCEL